MKRFIVSFMIFVVGSDMLMAQNYFGYLKNKQGESLPYISVVLKDCKDSTFVSGAVAIRMASLLSVLHIVSVICYFLVLAIMIARFPWLNNKATR